MIDLSTHTMAQPLPLNPYVTGSPEFTAYANCANLETNAFNLPVPDHGPTPLVCARLLGYMILHAPTHAGRSSISIEIVSCNNNPGRLLELASFYFDRFVRCCECVVNLVSY
jgi:hypothetical protein